MHSPFNNPFNSPPQTHNILIPHNPINTSIIQSPLFPTQQQQIPIF